MYYSYLIHCFLAASYVHLCKRNDPKLGECFTKTVYEIMPNLIKGIPEMDIPPIDPLEFSSIKIDTGNTGSVSLDIELLSGTASGLRNLKIENLKATFGNDGDNITFTGILEVPQVNIEGTYKLNGKILLFELNGQGHVSFNATDIRTDSVWRASTYLKKNKRHISLDKIDYNDVKIKNIRVKFDNLFGPNNEVLTDTVNNAINDNVDNLRGELEPIIKETLIQVILQSFNRVYRLFTLDELYLK
ncbi:hypothetical protein ILUMI_20050 [Ignelater luminosus]|uniref:Uncharacterized protein n=1 Tax=Ignelater luminosus TaxID=2038154 RepID=A0A8K0G589_IGNLU|nr:hypothetical protein ILUMI_20050 [Ignelater luminosus]